ncbi:LysM peptidoglycan-binding domain-containing protein [Phycicoccus sp. 3266]|uniref:LysM peptidoglycan-binding domain-containing protein n=1 Tax=Phycicoccus sp. 3266 TaxID=2817751 RepID=UPI00286388C4|nr:LysM peptidoglycan-binding domain-containing protein [Phycicoccus sp. 3266]MDR6861745.1 LysM repeat protein [Phycicoccus sp. 3266]
MTLNGTMLGTILDAAGARGGQIATLDTLARGATDAMRLGGMNTINRCAGFLSQTIQESAFLRTTKEFGEGAGREYFPYYGRTFMQVTWRDNYQRFGAWAHERGLVGRADVFVRAQDQLADLRWAWLGGVWYFTANHGWGRTLVQVSDDGDIKSISNAVNRGDPFSTRDPNGFATRRQVWDAARALGSAIVPSTGAVATVASPAPAGRVHVVQPGDTLGELAARFHTTVAVLQRLNNIPDANVIRVGQVLRIPGQATAGVPGVASPHFYTLVWGDTLSAVARRFGTTVDRLVKLNAIADPDRVPAGLRIRIA